DPKADYQHHFQRPVELLGKAATVDLRNLDFGPLFGGGGGRDVEHHGRQLFDFVDVALHDRVDRAAVKRNPRLEIDGEPLGDLPHLGLEAGPNFGLENRVFDVVVWAGGRNDGRLAVLHQDVRRAVLAEVGPLGEVRR